MRAAGGEGVEDGVEDFAWVVFGLSVVVDALWQAWLDELPLLVCEVCRIGFSCRVHRGIIPHFSLPVHALRPVIQLSAHMLDQAVTGR